MHGQTCLILAAQHAHIELVQLLLDRNADVNARDNSGNNALIKSFLSDISRLLIATGCNVNVIGANGRTALSGAAMQGDLALVQDLIAAGAELEPANGSATAALQVAATGNHLDIAEYLLAQGANANYRDHDLGYTPLLNAAGEGSVAMVSLLLAHEAGIPAKDNQGKTDVHNAAAREQ